MAYILKYRVEFKTIPIDTTDGTSKAGVFEIEELDPANNTVIDLKAGVAPILDSTPDLENKDFTFISTKCVVNIKNTNQYSRLINFVTEDERKFRGTLKIGGLVKFKGWLLTDVSTTDEIFNANVSDLRLTFSDGINTLDGVEYSDITTGRKLFGKASVIDILANINQQTGLELDLITSGHFSSQTITGNRPLESQKISQLRFLDGDKNPFSCKKVAKILCDLHFAKIYQRDGALWFVPFEQYRKGVRVFNRYNATGIYQSDFTQTGYKTVGNGLDISLGTETATRNYIAPYKKCSIATVFNQGYLFENEGLEYYNTGSSEPVFQIQTFQGLSSQENNVTFPNWTTSGTMKVSALTYSDAYMSSLKDKWFRSDAVTKFGAFPYNDKVFVIEKSKSTSGAYFSSSKAQIRKGTKINFKALTGHSLFIGTGTSQIMANDAIYQVFLVTNISSALRYILTSKGRWITEFATTTNLETKYIQANKRNSIIAGSNEFITITDALIDSEPCPIDGYLQIRITLPTSGAATNDIYQFQAPSVTITELPKGIDKVTYESTINGKHTVISDTTEIPICDNSIELIPCSIFDQDDKETDSYTLENIISDHALLLPLLEKQVQFSRSFLKVKLQVAFSANIEIGDIINFQNTDFSSMSGREFIVLGILGRDTELSQMQIIGCEIVETASNINYDVFIYNQGFKESIRRNIAYNSGAPSTESIAPWTWTNMGAYRILDTYYLEAAGQDIWDIADDFGYMWRPGGNVSVDGELNFPRGVTLPYNAKMGIMYRDSLDANSKFVFIVKLFNGTIDVGYRSVTGGTVHVDNMPGTGINRFKLDNSGSVQTLYYHNGNDWVLAATYNQLFSSTAKIGFCFALIGNAGVCTAKNVVYKNSDTPIVNKPTNLTLKVVQIASATTNQSSGQTNNKPTNLTLKMVQIKSAGDATQVTGTETPSTGFQVYSFHWKNGMSYIQGGGSTNAMKITVNTGSGTITDEYYSYKPNSTCYVKWKIDSGPWHGTYPGGDSINLTNYTIPTALRSKELTLTKYFFESSDFYRPIRYPLQQIIRFN
jgi:hypothetical protein